MTFTNFMDYTIKALIHDFRGWPVLVKRKESEHWSFAGGRPGEYESDEMCLRRELGEELHFYDIFGIRFFCRWDCRATIYIVEGRLPKPLKPFDEIDEVRSFKYPMMCNLTPLTKRVLKRYSKYPSGKH